MIPQYILRPMERDDISQILTIDRLSFPIPWSEKTYQFEVTNRNTSHLVVLELTSGTSNSKSGIQQVIYRLFGKKEPGPIVGYGGCWLIAGEAHISTIAVHPDFRGQGLGEIVLAAMLQRTMALGGEYSILEVRESNLTAQTLYEKYEYIPIGRRKGYYRDNNEDAILMEVRPLDQAYQQRVAEHVKTLRQRIAYEDRFSHPG